MMRAEVLTPWTGSGDSLADARRPRLADEYALARWQDVTGQPAPGLPPDPNVLSIEIVCGEAVLDAIDADPDYAVLWSETHG